MPWVEAQLRGQKVLARVTDEGTFAAVAGRVEIRYRPEDGRAYRAAVGNLARDPAAPLLPDDTCVPEVEGGAGGAVTGTAKGAGAVKSARAAARNGPAAPPGKDDWIAYTDGACSGNPGPAGAGLVVIPPGGSPQEGYRYLGEGTNNVAELTAVLLALEAVPHEVKGLVIHTDSQYAIGVLTKGWKAKANQELIAVLRKAIAARPPTTVRFVYVPGHAGVPLNERADALAREAIRTRRESRVELV